jgi:hypothetical protein
VGRRPSHGARVTKRAPSLPDRASRPSRLRRSFLLDAPASAASRGWSRVGTRLPCQDQQSCSYFYDGSAALGRASRDRFVIFIEPAVHMSHHPPKLSAVRWTFAARARNPAGARWTARSALSAGYATPDSACMPPLADRREPAKPARGGQPSGRIRVRSTVAGAHGSPNAAWGWSSRSSSRASRRTACPRCRALRSQPTPTGVPPAAPCWSLGGPGGCRVALSVSFAYPDSGGSTQVAHGVPGIQTVTLK